MMTTFGLEVWAQTAWTHSGLQAFCSVYAGQRVARSAADFHKLAKVTMRSFNVKPGFAGKFWFYGPSSLVWFLGHWPNLQTINR